MWTDARQQVNIDLSARDLPAHPPKTISPHTHTQTPPRQSFSTPLREMLVDEVQSRYLEAFLLNCDAQFPPAAVGNIYLWKKVRYFVSRVRLDACLCPHPPPLSTPKPL